MEFAVNELQVSDWPGVREIYLQGLATGQATFETQAPDFNDWDRNHLPFARIGAFSNERLVGWAALSRVSRRSAYAGVAEVSVYVATDARGNGVGRALLRELIIESERNGIWTLQASIFPENLASLKVHESLGFRRIGYRERISKLNGVWRDTVILERRSSIVGLD